MDVTLVDYLTGLPNMNYFMSLASAKKDSMTGVQQNAAILFFDLYGMRKFNSEYGFDNGNILLKSFAKKKWTWMQMIILSSFLTLS